MKKKTDNKPVKETPKNASKPSSKKNVPIKDNEEILMECDEMMTFHVQGKNNAPIADMNFLVDKEMPHGKFREGLLKAVEDAVKGFLIKWQVKQMQNTTKKATKKPVQKKKAKK